MEGVLGGSPQTGQGPGEGSPPACRAHAQPQGPARSLTPWSPGRWAGAGPGQGVHGDHACLPEPSLLSQRTRRVKKLNSREVIAPCPERTGRRQGSGVAGGEARKAASSLGMYLWGAWVTPARDASGQPLLLPDPAKRGDGQLPVRPQPSSSAWCPVSHPLRGVHSDPQLQPPPWLRARLGCAVLMSGSTPPRCQEFRSCSSCPPRGATPALLSKPPSYPQHPRVCLSAEVTLPSGVPTRLFSCGTSARPPSLRYPPPPILQALSRKPPGPLGLGWL